MRLHATKAFGLGVLVLSSVALPQAALAIEKPAATWQPASRSNYHRGRGERISMVVIHTIEGSLGSGINTFQNPGEKVSAHYLVGKSGQIVQMVGDRDTAYHVKRANGRAIGIEHEGFMSRSSTFTDPMYRASARLTRWLCDTYAIPIDRRHIVGHREVPGNDHGDPGRHFNWDYYIRLVKGAGDPSSTVTGNGSGTQPGSGTTGSTGGSNGTSTGGSNGSTGNSNGSTGNGSNERRRGIAGRVAGADEDTPDRDDPTHPQLSRRSQGEHVEELQRILNKEGYDIDQDGIFGSETDHAVRAFQRAHGLEVDGIVGPKTWRKLDAVNKPPAATTTSATRTPRRPIDGPLGDP
jgi:N-acetyl-anhydromuramyl-L-alanine amidase AmpD